MYNIIIGIITITIILYTMTKFRLSFIQLTLFELSRIGIAIYVLLEIYSLKGLFDYYCLIITSLCLGMLFGNYKSKKNRNRPVDYTIDKYGYDTIRKGLFQASIVFILLIIYHYANIGIPLFSENYETKRFLVASSGLFGIPSRISIYGPAIIAIFSISCFQSKLLSRKECLVILILCLICFWLTGHKSAIIAFAFMIICIYRHLINSIQIKYLFVFLVVVFVAAAISIAIQFRYFYSLENLELWEYIKIRLSVISIQPLMYIYYDAPEIQTITPFAFLHDLLYPFFKLFGKEVITVNSQISYDIYGTEYGEFTVPVTYTYAGYALIELGRIGGVIFSLFVGFICAKLYHCTNKKNTPIAIGVMVALEYFLLIGLTSGNLFYLISNVAVTLLIFLILLKIFQRKYVFSKEN